MKVLVLTHEYPPVGGGGGRVAQQLCRGLAQRGDSLQVITSNCGDLTTEDTDQGVILHRLNVHRKQAYKASFPSMFEFVFKGFWKASQIVRTWKPDLVHAHFAVPAGAIAWGIHKIYGIPYVLTAHLGDVPGGVPEKTGGWFRWIYPFTPTIWKNAAQRVAVSNFTRSLALKHYSLPIEVIPNGIPAEELSDEPIQVGSPPRLLFAGRMVVQKNPLKVVEMLAQLRELPWTCVMAGDGPLRAEVDAAIQAQGLGDRIQTPGWLKPEEVRSWMARSDILLMPSLSEGLPVVGLDALGQGLALVLTHVGGNVDLLEDGVNGFFLQEDWKEKLSALLVSGQQLQAFRQASRRKAEDFRLEKILDAYQSVFQAASGQVK
jgi:glycosyltransferase involved in cell wall biosynthesis